eukprot:GEMP01040766.1.p1 GENE.GEMP01040766.1~~GEMP01040766.1.p1  ORF type:complete len:308 (+),score=43.50 GEMP01040766.1:106-1029(+)
MEHVKGEYNKGDAHMAGSSEAPVAVVEAVRKGGEATGVAMPKVALGYSWNVFRYIGDYMHLAGVIVLFLTIAKNKNVFGFSKKTQAIYFIIFCTRYLDLFDHVQPTYLVFFKITYIATSAITLFLFFHFGKSYEARKDTCSLTVILLPCLIAAMLLPNEYTVMEVAWTYSEFLEGFSMVPQYIFSYRDGQNKDKGVISFICCLGGYRVFYAFNWIYKKIFMPHYTDMQSWIGGVVEILFFLDFLNYRLRGSSVLRGFVLKVDDKINEVQEAVEFKVLGKDRELGEGGSIRQRRVRKEADDLGDYIDV